MPTCAACAESRVPCPAPPSAQAMERRHSPATSSRDRRALQARCSPSPCTRLSRASDYYESSAPAPGHRLTLRLACTPTGTSATPVGFPRSLPFACPGRRPALPLRACRDTNAGMRWGAFSAHQSAGRDGPPCIRGLAHRLTQPVSIGFEPGSTLKGVLALVHLRYAFRSCLPRPCHPIVLARRVVVRAACHPHPQLRGQTALSFTGLPRQPSGGVLHPTRIGSASWRTLTM